VAFVFFVVSAIDISSVGIATNIQGIHFMIQKLLIESESIRYSASFCSICSSGVAADQISGAMLVAQWAKG
jgi:hypothetical protein